MSPLFELFASGSVAVAGHKTAAKPIDRTLGSSAIVPDIKDIARPGELPPPGPILTSGTIHPIRFVLIWHNNHFPS